MVRMKKERRLREKKVQSNMQGIVQSSEDSDEFQLRDECNKKWVSGWKKTVKKQKQ
jgi:hypothetical protein